MLALYWARLPGFHPDHCSGLGHCFKAWVADLVVRAEERGGPSWRAMAPRCQSTWPAGWLGPSALDVMASITSSTHPQVLPAW